MSSGSQSQLCFIDTNIWLYAFILSQDPNKSARAKTIIQQSDIIISSQTVTASRTTSAAHIATEQNRIDRYTLKESKYLL